MHGDMINAWNNLVRKPDGRKIHGKHRHAWEDNIKMDLKEIVWESMD